MAGTEGLDGGAELVADEEADPQLSSLARDVSDPAPTRLRDRQQERRFVAELVPGAGERDLSAASHEKLGAELLLELANLPAEHRLGDVEALRRPSEVQLLGDGDEVAEPSQVKGRARSATHAARVSLAAEEVLRKGLLAEIVFGSRLEEHEMNDDNGRVAIVTGGSRGIGRETAERLAHDGHAVVVNYAGSEDDANAAVASITDAGGRAVAARADVADEGAVAELFDVAEQEFGGIDVMVHAAGSMPLALLSEIDLDVFDQVIRTNLRGTFVVDQQAVRRVRAGGAIVNFSSSVVGLARETYSAYAASKGGVEAMTLIVARELRGRGVTINAVAPGPTATDLFLQGKDEETIAGLASAPPLERLGTPADIAELVAFLASPAGHWVNGQVIRINGGIV